MMLHDPTWSVRTKSNPNILKSNRLDFFYFFKFLNEILRTINCASILKFKCFSSFLTSVQINLLRKQIRKLLVKFFMKIPQFLWFKNPKKHIAVFSNGRVFKMEVIDGDGSPFRFTGSILFHFRHLTMWPIKIEPPTYRQPAASWLGWSILASLSW